MNKTKKRSIIVIIVSILVGILSGLGFYNVNKDSSTEEIVNSAVNEIKDYISTYKMSDEDVANLATTEIIEQTEEQEKATEQEVEDESFKLQGEVAYEGTSEYPQISLGDYKGLTYYSQIDSRWANKMYSSVGNSNQTIGTSGCGPTSAAMIVTATKGTITPDTMADLFVKYGYRSTNNGTYLSAFRFVADTFDIEYQETYKLDEAVNLLRNNYYLVVSVNNGLFTTGGHLMTIVGIEGDMLKIYDPYLYAGKFETSTRRGKVTVSGNTVYCSIENFRNYANYNGFYAYKHDGNTETNNNQPIITQNYTRYVKTNTGIGVNVRNAPNGAVVGALSDGTRVTVESTNLNWSNIGSNRWVCSDYLVQTYTNPVVSNTVRQTRKTKACYLYSNSNLTGTRYTYKANTTITILQNISSNVDKVRVNLTGRVAYINTSNYTNSMGSTIKNTVGQYKRLANRTYLYQNSNLTGIRYTYLPLTQIKIVRNVSSNIDYVYVVKTGRYAYINTNTYK